MSLWNYLKSKKALRIFSQFLTCFGFHFLLNKITTTWREKYKNSIWKIWKKLANKYKSSVIRKTRGEIYLKKWTIRRNARMPFERLWCGDSLEACQERGIFISIIINQPPCSSSVFHRYILFYLCNHHSHYLSSSSRLWFVAMFRWQGTSSQIWSWCPTCLRCYSFWYLLCMVTLI